ncbi:YIP1 family protein [Halegenticoccus tardaugens]|uniref:YIP1 family protein n=1 Tax=Halegenticoccus tardaugens TaxID=2071624 RepID=UPI00100B3EDE|nr:YIP1 family protein [Halegenticoccus tardaugens]
MTTWVENPRGGRDRGPRGLARAWVEVLVRPRRFFRNGVAPGDQAPGLVFGVAVALLYVGGLFAFSPGEIPSIGVGPGLSALLSLLLVGLIVAPAALHLTAALQTVLLILAVRSRAGVSETVQTIAYAAAPCVFAGIPVPEVRALCAVYGAVLLAVGIGVVHRTTLARAALASALPAALVFGYGFRGFGAVLTLLRQWYII